MWKQSSTTNIDLDKGFLDKNIKAQATKEEIYVGLHQT
jgi:hypothetical protein